MPVSGQKELGSNTITRHSRDFLMGVPIKKRKFPFIRPSSPPPSTIPEPVSQQEEQSNLKPESSSATAGSPRSASIILNSSQEENRLLSADTSVQLLQSNVIPQESTTQVVPDSGFKMCTETTILVSNDITAIQKIVESTDLQLAPNKHLVQKVEVETRNEKEPLENGKVGLSEKPVTAFQKIVGGTELQLAPNKALVQNVEEEKMTNKGLKNDKNISEKAVNGALLLTPSGPSFPDLQVQQSEGICEEEKLDPCSWHLALTERQSSSRSNHTAEPKINGTHLQGNRTHWDLNTMMDTWEGSMNHSAIVHEVVVDAKPVVHSNKTLLSESDGSLVASEKQTLEQSKDMSKLPTPPDPQTKNDILLHLSLSTSSGLQSSINPEPSHASSPKVDLRRDLSSNLKLSKNMLSPSSKLNLAGPRMVKSEPSDESNKLDFQGARETPLKLVKGRIVKTEQSVRYLQEHHKTSNIGNLKPIAHGSVKSESDCGEIRETFGILEEKTRNSEFYSCNTSSLPMSSQALPLPDVPNCTMALPFSLHPLPCPTSLGLSSSVEASNQSGIPTSTLVMSSTGEEAQETTHIAGASKSDSVSESVCTDGKKLEVADMASIGRVKNLSVVGPESSRIKSVDMVQSNSHGNSDVAGSDEEKINIFDDMQDDCSSDTDDESDVTHGVGAVICSEDKHNAGEDEDEDDDYEDGEVREPLLHSSTEVGVGPDKEIQHACHGIADNREASVSGCPGDGNVTIEDKSIRFEDTGVTKSSHGSGEFNDIQLNNKYDNFIIGPACLQETSAAEVPTIGTVKMELIKAAHRGLLNCVGREDGLKGCEDLLSDGTVSTSQGISPGDDQGSTASQEVNIARTNPEETKLSFWPKTESLAIGDEATKDVNSKGNQSRIINLARAFSGPSLGRMRPFAGRFLPSRIERERFNDGARNGDKLHPRGSRDDGSMDGRNKFERQRNHDQPVGSTGSDFMHGRGRPDKRFDSSHAAVMVARDSTVVGAGRRPLNDELPNFRHPPSRRRSPGGRGRPVSHGVQIVRRSARDISPDRCIGRGDPNLIGLRPEKKFMRTLPDNMMDTVFSRSQPQYQQVDDHFVRGERSFSPIQRKGPLRIPRIRSRSPSRTRSPGPWSSPRRRSPDGFGRPELIHRRSPPFYRIKRMRSPHQRPVFTDDIEGRRHGSPPYISRISNDMREMGTSREPDHPRSFVPNRSPSGRVLPRGTRRFDMLDPRERIENDEYFTGPVRSDRFHEIGGEGGSEGRRLCSERRRSFRPPYDSAEVEKFHFHVEAGPRPYRFSPEGDTEFHERGNLRVREFERRVKSQTGNTPRRTRSVEEHEENYRNGEEGWHGAGFEDVSPAKRRRF